MHVLNGVSFNVGTSFLHFSYIKKQLMKTIKTTLLFC